MGPRNGSGQGLGSSGRRAQRGPPLRLLRPRDLRQHRRPALERDPARRRDDDDPIGKDLPKKDIVAIMAAHGIPYAATVSLAHPEDTLRKMRLALDLPGFRFLHVLSLCPTGWKSEPSEGIEIVRLAVRSGLYPVYEVIDGGRVVVNVEPELSTEALEKYFAGQGRFKKSGVDLTTVRAGIDRTWKRLRALAG